MTRIYIGNLPFSVDEADVRKLLAEHGGDVKTIEVQKDHAAARSRGFAFVEMSAKDATRAIGSLHGHRFHGRKLLVNEAREGSEFVTDLGVSLAAGTESSDDLFQAAAGLLGGTVRLRQPMRSRLEAHDAIEKGIPGGALEFLLENMETLPADAVLNVLGMSSRTVQRRKLAPKKLLDREQSGRTWKFAQVLAKAKEVFGDQAQAESWLATPAIALDQRRPIDLLSSPAGAEMVDQLLGRLEYGVYT